MNKFITAIFMFMFSSAVVASEIVDSIGFTPTKSPHANLMFIGTVVNDDIGENYNYVFQMQRDGVNFHVFVAVADAQTHELIISEDSTAIIQDPESYNWNVGHAFLRFNPINASWILGLKEKNKFSFNFKIDLLKPLQQTPVTQELRFGVELLLLETGELTGLIQRDAKSQEQFVTARTAWFRQIWLTKIDEEIHNLNGLLCQLDDWSGFSSINLPEAKALRGSIVNAFDAHGKPVSMSQFIDVHEDQKLHDWKISITSPVFAAILHPVIDHESVIAGFISPKDQHGFCVISKDVLGMKDLHS